MATYFADTSFWIALVDRHDKFHEKAIHSSAELDGSLITTQAILLETANLPDSILPAANARLETAGRFRLRLDSIFV
jgi:predicted nucleic acid-binding protein